MLNFTHDAAYRLLLRFRHMPSAVKGFLALASANVYITDVGMSQVLIGTSDNDRLTGVVLNFGGGPYTELFDGLCAVSSSATPMITTHELSSYDPIESDYLASRLGMFLVDSTVSGTHRCFSLISRIAYPI